MKIGFSLSRCLMDIVDGKVLESDVMFIASATMYENKKQMASSLDAYFYPNQLDQATELAYRLWDNGRLHQPRLFTHDFRGLNTPGIVWMDLAPVKGQNTEAVQEAWETYRTLLTLSN